MPLMLIQGLRGGVGTTSLVANLAIGLAQTGLRVAVLDMAARSTMALHFGLEPTYRLPAFDAEDTKDLVIHGVTLRDAYTIADRGDLTYGLASGEITFAEDMLFIADVGSADMTLFEQLRPYAALDMLILAPSGECLAGLPEALDAAGPNTRFVLNKADDTRKLARHTAVFVHELLGDKLLATIRSDEAVVESAAMIHPLGRHAPVSAALQDISGLCGSIAELVPLLQADSTVEYEQPRQASQAA
jgi:chromosome partitioning protein